MSIPKVVRDLARKPVFWTDYTRETEPRHDYRDRNEPPPYPELLRSMIVLREAETLVKEKAR
jgi:hypothetical protein